MPNRWIGNLSQFGSQRDASAWLRTLPAVRLAPGSRRTADGTRTHTSRAKVGYPTVRRQRRTEPEASVPQVNTAGIEIRMAVER